MTEAQKANQQQSTSAASARSPLVIFSAAVIGFMLLGILFASGHG